MGEEAHMLVGEEAHMLDRVDCAKLNYWIFMDVQPDACPFEDVLRAQIMYARERLAGARERRALIDISEVAKASVRLINKKWTLYESCQN